MSELQLMVSVVDRDRLAPIITLYREEGLELHEVALGHGTARYEMLSFLGLTDSEKAVCFSMVTGALFKKVKRRLQREIRIDVPGTGIVFTVPLSSVGGKRELSYLTYGLNFQKEEEQSMKDTKYELLLVISNQGYSGDVMAAASKAGAGGGTILHAQGTGKKEAEKFLGISLASEKDMVFIVARKKKKNEIMEAIMKETGIGTPAGSIVFSLPVTDTAGLRLMEDEDETEEEPKKESEDKSEEKA